MERHQPIAAAAAQGNHPGGRCQRAGPSGPTAGGLRADPASAHVRLADRQAIRFDSSETARRQEREGQFSVYCRCLLY